jgi:hypothetical protein
MLCCRSRLHPRFTHPHVDDLQPMIAAGGLLSDSSYLQLGEALAQRGWLSAG